jgi:hypothetical protein
MGSLFGRSAEKTPAGALGPQNLVDAAKENQRKTDLEINDTRINDVGFSPEELME